MVASDSVQAAEMVTFFVSPWKAAAVYCLPDSLSDEPR